MTQKEEFDKAIEILDTIEENINVCCAVTMEPDEVLELAETIEFIPDMVIGDAINAYELRLSPGTVELVVETFSEILY